MCCCLLGPVVAARVRVRRRVLVLLTASAAGGGGGPRTGVHSMRVCFVVGLVVQMSVRVVEVGQRGRRRGERVGVGRVGHGEQLFVVCVVVRHGDDVVRRGRGRVRSAVGVDDVRVGGCGGRRRCGVPMCTMPTHYDELGTLEQAALAAKAEQHAHAVHDE